ncbi:MAG: hypothetical protein KKD97_16250 [Gammaproteobacteria bacterium]|nr:hypothetical protein [Gammaproteobacteria bacterium]
MKSLWISKYALTYGIKAADWDGKVSDYGYVFPSGYCSGFKLGRDAHETEAEAKQAAEKKRLAKIASLKKQIAKLEAMSFTGKKGGDK